MRRAVAAAALLACAACAHAPSPEPARPPPPSAERPAAGHETGLASFYGRHLQGRRTASGERYDAAALTCAHRTQPFGAFLRVTELETGRSVVVRVNDRGPFVQGRVVDLSYAAARRLGMVQRGVARVRVERVPPAE